MKTRIQKLIIALAWLALPMLVHNSKAVHRAYAKRALMKIPSLEDYEQRAAVHVDPAA